MLPGVNALPPIEEANQQSANTPAKDRQKELGQFLTPAPVADFMASLFETGWSEVKLLDAGAGTGILSTALIKRLCHQEKKPKSISLTAYEIDASLIDRLYRSIRLCREECSRVGIMFKENIFNEDFIKAAIPITDKNLFSAAPQRFNAVIVNPPYRKINSNSGARLLLRSIGIETSNLYSGFLALLTRLVADEGEMVAITPRSFCNGPYFKSFREEFLEKMSLRRLHVFTLRSAAFKNDHVLQENVIFHAVKSTIKPAKVIISTSSGEPGDKIKERVCFYRDVVSPHDPGMFIHLVTDDIQDIMRRRMSKFSASLTDLGLEVSTGRVVDFRAAEFLRAQPEKGTVPLVYPCHFKGGYIQWPRLNSKKPNAIICNTLTKDLLVPVGIYVLTKRFTSNEEKRRVVACIYDPDRVSSSLIGFENHLNYFHACGRGLPMNLARGLAAFLNSSMVDVYFRQFNGHTQVNATDLRSMKYPSRKELEKLGDYIGDKIYSQNQWDELLDKEFDIENQYSRESSINQTKKQ